MFIHISVVITIDSDLINRISKVPIMSAVREEDRIADIKRKISIIKTIIQKSEHCTQNRLKFDDPIAATIFLTNESQETIEEASKCTQIMELRSLLKKYEDLKNKAHQSKILSCHIHEILYENYVNKRHLLKLNDVYSELAEFDVIENQLEVLKRWGYVWRRLTGDKCILIEDPEVQAKRIKYLLDMKRCRKLNRTIVYVEEKAIPADMETLNEFQNQKQNPGSGKYAYLKIAVSPQLGVLSVSINNNSETFKYWLTNEVAPHLNDSFVLVIDEKTMKESSINQPPNPEAKKRDMVDWLERNNIPCCSTMHRAELYELIDIYKDKLSGNNTFTGQLFKARGVEFLQRPDGWPALNYFEPLWNMEVLWNPVVNGDVVEILGKRIQMMVDIWTLEKFQCFNNDLEAIETSLFEKDMEIEEVIDKLFTMARDVAITDIDLPNYREVQGNDFEKYVNIVSGSLFD